MLRCWQREKPLSSGARDRCAPGYGMQDGTVQSQVPAVQRLGTGDGPCEPYLLPVSTSKNLIIHTPLALGNLHSWRVFLVLTDSAERGSILFDRFLR